MDYLIYGANGYTGELIAREAVKRGHRPILAGRSAAPVAALAQALGLTHRVFALDDARAARRGLEGVSLVAHCAGPFSRTFRGMAGACIAAGAHYLDITGEVEVLEALASEPFDHAAREAGVMLMPGAGYDVVPSDCLAAHLKARLPTATRLALGFQAVGRMSRGTATTMVENLHRGGLVRRGGRLTPVPTAWRTRRIDFGRGPVKAVTIPWGDVATAWHSTGIPDIEVYAAAPRLALRAAMRAVGLLRPLLARPAVVSFLSRRVRSGPAGPSETERARGACFLWGEVEDDAGRTAVSRLRGPEGYTFTAHTVLAIVERALRGEALAGFHTPSQAYGADFVLGLPGVERSDS
ncbi:MAG: saccharopine dehydrogenase NADP-binding domain-containing protein [Planctomycetes bacterium]|nr:saccharopine dehydrogenase NADP-binding domain-containing protein [Planctomycetota bacterium]